MILKPPVTRAISSGVKSQYRLFPVFACVTLGRLTCLRNSLAISSMRDGLPGNSSAILADRFSWQLEFAYRTCRCMRRAVFLSVIRRTG
ncbi:MAG: hypothetical protein CM1200mP29_01350 [Verrucomicrobiota bacterium]|nr:MAG: hypothetical protein CM1200mP29_01350 [Verrucomicrobiota bacterium]